MSRWTWPTQDVLIAIHEAQLAEHGGGAGVRDHGLLESAIAKPENMAGYGEPEVAELAGAYAWGVSRNHPFIDGNKRTGFVALELFLSLNGWELDATDEDCVITMLAVAAGDLTQDELTTWIRERARRR